MLCEELRQVLSLEKEVLARKNELKRQVVEMSGGDRLEYGIKVQLRKAKGSIDWEKFARDHVDAGTVDFLSENYRKPSRSYYEARSY